MTRTRLFAVLLVFALVPASAAAQSRDQMQIYADLRQIQDQVGKIQVALNQLVEQNGATSRRVDDQASATVKAFADINTLVKEQMDLITQLQNKIDSNTLRVSQVAQGLSDVRDGFKMVTTQLNTLTNLLQSPVGASGSGPAPATGTATAAPPDATAPASGPMPAINLPASSEALFNQAMGEYMGSHYDNAIDGFTELLAKYPDAPEAAESQYDIGRSYYNQQKYQEAIAAYNTLLSKYKTAEKVPDALLDEGVAYQALKDRTHAEQALNAVIRQFPTSSQAAIAKERLDALNSNSKK